MRAVGAQRTLDKFTEHAQTVDKDPYYQDPK